MNNITKLKKIFKLHTVEKIDNVKNADSTYIDYNRFIIKLWSVWEFEKLRHKLLKEDFYIYDIISEDNKVILCIEYVINNE